MSFAQPIRIKTITLSEGEVYKFMTIYGGNFQFFLSRISFKLLIVLSKQ